MTNDAAERLRSVLTGEAHHHRDDTPVEVLLDHALAAERRPLLDLIEEWMDAWGGNYDPEPRSAEMDRMWSKSRAILDAEAGR